MRRLLHITAVACRGKMANTISHYCALELEGLQRPCVGILLKTTTTGALQHQRMRSTLGQEAEDYAKKL